MRALLVGLLILSAAPVLAQTQYADSAGAYIGLSGGYYGSGSPSGRFGVSADLGYRFNPSVDAEVRLASTPYSWSAGAGAGYTWRIGPESRVRLSGGLLYHNADATVRTQQPPRQRFLMTDAALTVSRTIPLVGSLRFDPAIGVYGAVTRDLSMTFGDDGVLPRESFPEAGVAVDLPLSFRLFGRTATLAPSMRIPVAGGRAPMAAGGTTFRLNF